MPGSSPPERMTPCRRGQDRRGGGLSRQKETFIKWDGKLVGNASSHSKATTYGVGAQCKLCVEEMRRRVEARGSAHGL
eukprot:363259-Chlamydomonas_euryale.AAC.4